MRHTTCLLLVLAAAGCSYTDPYTKDGFWKPTGANDRNIAAMAQNKSDLIRGRGAPGSDGVQAASAIELVQKGTPRPLPATSSRSSGGGN